MCSQGRGGDGLGPVFTSIKYSVYGASETYNEAFIESLSSLFLYKSMGSSVVGGKDPVALSSLTCSLTASISELGPLCRPTVRAGHCRGWRYRSRRRKILALAWLRMRGDLGHENRHCGKLRGRHSDRLHQFQIQRPSQVALG